MSQPRQEKSTMLNLTNPFLLLRNLKDCANHEMLATLSLSDGEDVNKDNHYMNLKHIVQ